jgi:hypothetical protein
MSADTTKTIKDQWLADRVTYIEGLKKPSEQQELLALLFRKSDCTPREEKQLAVLIRFERAAERAALARADVTRLLNDNKESERKARNHRLILQGLLLDFAELQTWDRAELLGALVSLATSSTITVEQRAEWKKIGVKRLAEKEATTAR